MFKRACKQGSGVPELGILQVAGAKFKK